MRRHSFSAVVMLAFTAGLAGQGRADHLTIVGKSDANLTAPTTVGDFTGFNTLSPSLYGLAVTQFAGLNAPTVENRSVIEFDVSALGSRPTIQGATFDFQISSITSTPGQLVGIYGYAGTGSIGLADATTKATLLGSFDPTSSGLGVASVSLTGSALQDVLGNSGFLGLRLQGINSYENMSLDSLETAALFPQFEIAPSLAVSYTAAATVPEPSSMVLLGGMGAIAGLFVARRRSSKARVA